MTLCSRDWNCLFVMVPLPVEPRSVSPSRLSVSRSRRLSVGFASGVVRLCESHSHFYLTRSMVHVPPPYFTCSPTPLSFSFLGVYR